MAALYVFIVILATILEDASEKQNIVKMNGKLLGDFYTDLFVLYFDRFVFHWLLDYICK